MFLTSFWPERKKGLANWEANSHTREMKIPFVSPRVSICFGSLCVSLSPTANDFRVLPQMVPPKNAEFRRLTLQTVIIFLVYFSSPAWQREEVPCSTRDLHSAFSPLLACYRRWLVFSTR